MKWLACELHTHTLHSDGSQTLSELAAGASKLGFDAIALTDHNTMSGLADRKDIAKEHGLLIIPGMEWTTFHGHMVTLGLDTYVDWRTVDKDGILDGIAAVHEQGGVAGLAHPFRIGSPACTGCYWEYEIKDWSAVDYIEVWSGTFAPIQHNNQRAFALWNDKLNEGYRISATSGRDWHTQADTTDPLSVTYLGIPDDADPDEEQLVQALRRGHVSVTVGPLLELGIKTGGAAYDLGAIIPAHPPDAHGGDFAIASVSIDFSVRPGRWTLPGRTCKLVLQSNLGTEVTREVYAPESHARLEPCELNIPDATGRRWIRAELWGSVQGAYMLIAFTNAIYFE
ncbi:CehA/McbA family metallohydrolase [Paenibacillus hubeiensis]|uniref:CehA/McbA family metallohydrolase n=1 Tax=Paenibacillus hubeiensis TaxID=3077330 RepID=UPI0031BB14F0